MGCRLLAAVLFALVVAAPAAAQTRTLWPGVTFDGDVQFTPHGPVALNVMIGPRPGGTTTLEPVLSNETLTGLHSEVTDVSPGTAQVSTPTVASISDRSCGVETITAPAGRAFWISDS